MIRAAKNPRDRAILELFYATGCRIAELVAVRLEHVDFTKRTIMVNGKTGDTRVLFGLTAKRSLKDYLGGRKTGYLFESQYRVQKGCVSWNGSCWAGYCSTIPADRANLGTDAWLLVQHPWVSTGPGRRLENWFQTQTEGTFEGNLIR